MTLRFVAASEPAPSNTSRLRVETHATPSVMGEPMATILAFRAHGMKSQSGLPRAAHVAPAEIVIFPGIRYERWEETPSQPRSRRARPRDEILLED